MNLLLPCRKYSVTPKRRFSRRPNHLDGLIDKRVIFSAELPGSPLHSQGIRAGNVTVSGSDLVLLEGPFVSCTTTTSP